MKTDSFNRLSNYILLFMKERFGAVSEHNLENVNPRVSEDLVAFYGQY